MKKYTRILTVLCTLVLICTIFASCVSSYSIPIKTDTGDEITVTLDTSKGHTIEYNNNVLTLKDKDGGTLGDGTLIESSTYDEYSNLVAKNLIIGKGKTKKFEYILHKLNESGENQNQMLVKIANSKTGMQIQLNRPVSEAKELAKMFSFDVTHTAKEKKDKT